MKKDHAPSRVTAELRRRAEARWREQQSQAGRPPTAAEARRLVHELQVHQIELELQNQTLLEVRDQLEQSLERYTDLYDFAPVGYFTLTGNGTILDLNLAGAALLGHDRSRLIRRRFGLFVSPDTRLTFSRFLDRVLAGTEQERCEIALAAPSAAPRRAHLEGASVAAGGAARLCRLAVTDITERERAEKALRHSEAQYRAAVETSPDGFCILDRQGRLLEVNEAYTHLSGYTRAELLSMRIGDLDARDHPEELAAHLDRITRTGSDLFQTPHRAKSGRLWQAEINVSYWPITGGRFFAFFRDVHRRQRSEALLKARLHLSEIAAAGSLDDLLQAALDEAERFTGSRIGFLHFVDPDQEHLTLQAWSSNTLKSACTASGKSLHYPISEAGVWVECVRRRQPVVHNDYAGLPGKKGLPQGHATLSRELTVPVLRDDRVVAIFGVGNKPEDYTEEDVEAVQHLAELVLEVVEHKRTEAWIAHLAYHDALTQLPNRALLADRLQQAMAQVSRDRRRLAVCYLDLDGFKPINDTWGHVQGDRVLVEVAHRLKHCVRVGDTVARLGGDEFALLLGNLKDVEECERALDRVMAALQPPFVVAGQPVRLSASLGVALHPNDHSDPETLIRHADQAMYAAKQAGGHRYRLFDAVQDRRARDHHEILLHTREGLTAGEFRLYYQPKIDMRRGAVVGVEALIRWRHPEEKTLLLPARFMPAVETSELAVEVGHWVLNEALRQAAAWASEGLRLPVSVNLSARHLQEPDFVARLRALLAAHPTVRGDWLEMEILETAAFEDLPAVSTLIESCRQLGVRFSLDDFGTGYSSLTYLKCLPVQALKIDRSFVREMLADAEALAIVQGVIGLSVAFRRDVIAEGVETVEHGRRLLRLGCDLAQGYGIAPPMPPERIPAWVAGWTPPSAWADSTGRTDI